MKFRLEDLDWAASQGLITPQQASAVREALMNRDEHRPQFSLGHVIYYFGALVVISAMTWFMVEAWERLGGAGMALVSLAYTALFFVLDRFFWNTKSLRIPGGLLITAAVSMTPLTVYGIQRALGAWPQSDPGVYSGFYVWIKGSWFWMEIATIGVGILALRRFRFPFVTAPIAVALWFLSMDVVPLMYGGQLDWDQRKMVSIVFGFIMVVISYLVDRKTREDYSFWGYLFGMTALWGGLTMLDSGNELAKLGYCALNIFFILLSVFLDRKVFIVFGAMGVVGYVGHLASEVFRDALLFPVALSGIGLAVILLGVYYQKNQKKIEATILASLPTGVLKLRPKKNF